MEIEIKLPKVDFDSIMRKIWIFPMSCWYDYDEAVDDYFTKMLSAENLSVKYTTSDYKVIVVHDDKITTVWASDSDHSLAREAWKGSSSYGDSLWDGKRPSRWNLRKFRKLVKVAQKDRNKKGKEDFRKKLGV